MAGSIQPSTEIKVPDHIDGVTPQWLSQVVGFPIDPDNFHVIGNIQEGMGYLSSIFRISCQTVESGSAGNKQLDLIVKVLPAGESEFEQFSRGIAISEGFDIAEINFYTKVLSDILAELPELGVYYGKFVTGIITEDPRNSIIVMEDLKPAGYYNRTFAQSLSPNQIDEAIKFLAKFHYASTAIQHKRNKTFQQLYPFICVREEIGGLYTFIADGYSKLDEFFESQNCSKELRAYYKRLEGHIGAFATVFERAFKPLALIHGDLWSNNIMVNDNPDLCPIKAIDWQLISGGDPVYDLGIATITLIPPSSLNRVNLDRLVRLYFDTYKEYCLKNGLEILLTRDYEEFVKDFYTTGLGCTFMWFTFSRDPFVTNFSRLVKIYEFFQEEADIVSHLVTLA